MIGEKLEFRMKKQIAPAGLSYFVLVAILLVAAVTGNAQDSTPWSQNVSPLPAPTGFVNDYAGVIDPATKQQLEAKLKNFRDTTNPSVEIAVAVVKTTGERAIFDYSLAVARGWKIGSKADDNPSALLFIAVDDRKYFTQVSKDLEDELPDGVAGSLQRQYLVPEFNKGNYGKGISDTIDAYIATIRNKGNAPAANTAQSVRRIDGRRIPVRRLDLLRHYYNFHLNNDLFAAAGRPIRQRSGPLGRHRAGRRRRRVAGNIASGIIGGLIGSALSGGGSSSSSDWGGSSGGSDWGGFGGGGDFGGGGAGGDW